MGTIVFLLPQFGQIGGKSAAETAITDKYSRTNNFFIINSEIFFLLATRNLEMLQFKTVGVEQKVQYAHRDNAGFIPADFYTVPHQNDFFE